MTEEPLRTDVDGGDWPDATPSEAVVLAVARETERSPLDISPLARTLDSDALDLLFAGSLVSEARLTVSFDYAGCRVTVDSDGARARLRDGR